MTEPRQHYAPRRRRVKPRTRRQVIVGWLRPAFALASGLMVVGGAAWAIASLPQVFERVPKANPHATVTVKVPEPRATVTVTVPEAAPTVTVTAIATDSGGALPALGQIGAFLLGVGTMLLGIAALLAWRRGKERSDSKAGEG